MDDRQRGVVVQHVCQALETARAAACLDPQLLDDFVSRRDEDAFATLLRRHGPLVLGVCRRVLQDVHAAEDAFQATFLVLARKAAAVRKRRSLGSWLYGVAFRVAAKSRAKAIQQRRRESQAVPDPATVTSPADDLTWRELQGLLDEELNRLPEKWRDPLVLCYLQGKTQDEAAQLLHLSLGTFRRRLDRARSLLHDRLTRRGLALSAALVPVLLVQHASAAISERLLSTTREAALLFVTGPGAALGSVSSTIVTLAEEIMPTLGNTHWKWAIALLIVGLSGVGAGWLGLSSRAGDASGSSATAALAEPPAREPPQSQATPAPDQPLFPRRLMAVSVNNYFYLNPVSFGAGDQALDKVVRQLARRLHIADDQVALLSDGVPRPDPKAGTALKSADELANLTDEQVKQLLDAQLRAERPLVPFPPTKPVIEHNVGRFLDTCTGQDRIILLLVGHAVEFGAEAYFAPIEGERTSRDSLISFRWLLNQLAGCNARQKVLILDVCRFNPARDAVRGKTEPMSGKLDALLLNPPPGVQILSACTAGQYSYELDDPKAAGVEGGILMSLIAKLSLKDIAQRPDEPLPIQTLAQALSPRTRYLAHAFAKRDQTPRLTGTAADSKVIYDPKASRPARFGLQLVGAFEKGQVTQSDLTKLFAEIIDLPPVRRRDRASLIDLDAVWPYAAARLLPYADDNHKSPLREKVREAIQLLKDKSSNEALPETFVRGFDPKNAQQINNFKNQIAQIQQNQVGLVQFRLDTALEELDAMKADRAKESKRWQALTDFVRARLAVKIGYLAEYNYMLGQLRKDLPPLDPEVAKGWQLAPRQDISDRDAAKYIHTARTILEQLAKDHAGTPWEVLAWRERLANLGLEWRPLPK